ncbi:MAG: hypothetical protein Q8Q59_14945 [Luteolibacter sp.]|nr:hypothetical protein [Luteolibacter sp.]
MQTSTTLEAGSWSDVIFGITVDDDADGVGLDHVTVTIPRGGAPKLFARLQVVVP